MKRPERTREFSPLRFRLAVVSRRSSVPEVAERLEVSKWTLTAWLSGRSDPPLEDVRAAERYLKLSPGFLEGTGTLAELEDEDRAA